MAYDESMTSLMSSNMTSEMSDVTLAVQLRPSPLLTGSVIAVFVLAAACGVLGILYYFIFYSHVQCSAASGRRLLEPGSAGLSTAHDSGGSAVDRGASTHIFMFKKS